MKITALAGGVGGAKMADGLAQILPAEDLTVIVNTGDDFDHLGLKISPDLDTVCYTLAGLANTETGWGREFESWGAFESISALGGPDWFRLGDRDLGTHLERTRRFQMGQSLSQITTDFCAAWGIGPRVLPMTDDNVPTVVHTEEGELAFQDYFVARHCEPKVLSFRFADIESANPAPGVIEAIKAADLILICPSNPWVSIDPILSVPGIRDEVATKRVVAVSPIIGGKAVKGPAAKMFIDLGITPSAQAVAQHYGSLLDGFVLDGVDDGESEFVRSLGIQTFVSDTFMKTVNDRGRLAKEILDHFNEGT